MVAVSVGWQASSLLEQQPPHLSILVHFGMKITVGSSEFAKETETFSGRHSAFAGIIPASKTLIVI